jgi:hypothetical protein
MMCLRKWDIPLMSMDAMRKYYLVKQHTDPELANMFIGLRRIVKEEALKDKCCLIPIAAMTRFGLQPRLWVGHTI